MTSNSAHKGFLRQLSSEGAVEQRYLLSTTQEMVVGREPQCQIAVDPFLYGSVSRQHAKIKPISSSSDLNWQVCDLGSANGTYVNNQRLQGCQILRAGDRITLGEDGPEFIFEYQLVNKTTPPLTSSGNSSSAKPRTPVSNTVHGSLANPQNNVTASQLFPIFSTGKDFSQKTYLLPASITVGFVILLFTALGNTVLFNFLLAAYISGAAYYFIYKLCGKHKPWWVLLSSALMTAILIPSPVFGLLAIIFRRVLPGGYIFEPNLNFLSALITHFFGAGLLEELFKALPVLAALYIGRQVQPPWREKIGVWEPLDGILLGSASAVGFTLYETLEQYVPNQVQNVALQAGIGAGELIGLQLLIPRILGSVAGHMAYSGYLGYFIGLSILKPSKRWSILGIGYLSAAGLHAFWNATASDNLFIAIVIGILSYAFLAAAILKARKLSPARKQNFATRFFN